MKREIKKVEKICLPGIERQEEECYLADTIAIAQRNLENAKANTQKLNEDVDNWMREANETQDKMFLTLWNNAKAQLRDHLMGIARYEKARKKPYFGRIDYWDEKEKRDEVFYIGRVGIMKDSLEPAVIDWRTPVASVYYENAMGKGTYTVSAEGTFEIDLKRKRSYEIENDQLKDFYDLDVVANDELLTKYLSKNKTEVLGEIIATIQREQNQIIRRSPKTNLIVQGAAGSGKTTVAMHRISYILFNYENDFKPKDFYIIGSNQILLNYITSVLPELDVYGARQMTMEELFIRLLYEDWDKESYTYHSLDKNDKQNAVKSSKKWFEELEQFCWDYEDTQISRDEVYMEKTDKLLIGKNLINSYLSSNPLMSMQSKILMLNEILYSKYENEILGKHISFTKEEKKAMEKKYRTYYGKNDWKGSIYELYREFLKKQIEKGCDVEVPDNSFDVYDLAALAYLYKRIKELDPIREATHMVIDEAQDFGMMAYFCLNYCMRGCTYTIMGDTSQNIHYQYGLNDWEELKKLILTGIHDSFCLLKKSYRNTIEISEFATEILRHGDFSIYPVEPIIRHGNAVQIQKCADEKALINEAAEVIRNWQRQGYETIAVVCRSEKEAETVSEKLRKYIPIKGIENGMTEFGNGVMVLPVVYTKGLEFDAVLVFDPTTDKYPVDNGHVKMLYVTATRALHELVVIYKGNLTPLIAEKIPEGKHLQEFSTDYVLEEDERKKTTQKELLKIQKETADYEMERRNSIGPKRIKADTIQNRKGETTEPILFYNKTPFVEKEKKDKKIISSNKIKRIPQSVPVNSSPYEYGSLPDSSALPVKGHTKADSAVRWVKKMKTGVKIVSSYGVLTITPVTEECLHVTFVKGQAEEYQDTYWSAKAQDGLKWSAKESPSLIEIATKKLTVRIEKKNGAMHFMTSDKRELLSESNRQPRIIQGSETWSFFEFNKKEKIKSKGILAEDLMLLNQKARYISFGRRPLRMPLLLSSRGYGIAVASEKTTLFCGIAMYGPYLYTEGIGQIDYYFMYGESIEKNIDLYDWINKNNTTLQLL